MSKLRVLILSIGFVFSFYNLQGQFEDSQWGDIDLERLKGCSRNEKEEFLKKLAYEAITNRDINAMKQAIQLGFNVNWVLREANASTIATVVYSRNNEMLELILNSGYNIVKSGNVADGSTAEALEAALEKCNWNAIQLMVSRGAPLMITSWEHRGSGTPSNIEELFAEKCGNMPELR